MSKKFDTVQKRAEKVIFRLQEANKSELTSTNNQTVQSGDTNAQMSTSSGGHFSIFLGGGKGQNFVKVKGAYHV